MHTSLPTPARRAVWSRARSIARDLSSIRDILRDAVTLSPEASAALKEVQALYARVSRLQAQFSDPAPDATPPQQAKDSTCSP